MEINVRLTANFNEFITDIFDRIIHGQLEGLDTINDLIESEQNLSNIINSTMNDNSNDELCKRSHFKLKDYEVYNNEENIQCSICTEDITKDSKIFKCSSCNNILHHSCMENWIQYNVICPLCRNELNNKIHDSFLQWIDTHLDI